ncbi:tetratricopeptide repeat protein [Bacteroidetes/Chlorobi group bacterium Naka2016]|jgi:tetratricopeptide (TPR) repeat protein|nr:MAG: tetratricopeptide repeat protein [Bacteroidetes/Chlorobi group bacterium Naka2016]
MAAKRRNFSPFLSILVLIVLNIFFYLPSLEYDFVWDDKDLYINAKNIPLNNPWGNLWEHFVPKKDKMFMPITYFFWSFISSIGGVVDGQFVPYPFHLFNLIVHIINSLLVFLLLKKLLNSNLPAVLGALFFSLNPVQIESVVWISEARGLLSALFGFSALLFFVSYKKNVFVHTSITSILIILSILSKPSGIVFSLLIILTDWFLQNKPKAVDLLKRNWFYLVLVVPFVFVSFRGEATKIIEFEIPLTYRPVVWLNAIGFYIQKILVPINLSPGYGITLAFLKKDVIHLYPILIALTVFVLGFFVRFKKQYFYSLLFFVVAFLPVSNLVSFYYQYWSTVADRYVYVSIFGFAFLFAYFVETHFKKFQYALLIIIPIIYFIISRSEIAKWQNEYTLWNDCIEKYPKRIPQVYLGRGMAFEAKNEMMSALDDYSESIELDSNFYFGYYNRGNVLFDLQKYDKAIADFTRTTQINPKFVNAYVNRGLCYLEIGNLDSAIWDFDEALHLDSTQVDVVLYLAEAWEKKDSIEKALQYYRKAVSMGYKSEEIIKRIKFLENQKRF